MSNSNSRIYRLSGYKKRETEKAILFEVVEIDDIPTNKDSSMWFPISQISSALYNPPNSQDLDWIEVPEWIVEAKGLTL